jgi:folate-binding protein YgfZ
MKRSRLYEIHAKLGAVFVEQAGWEVPVHYGDPVAEHLAVRRGVGMMDLSQRGKIRVIGEDREKWLQSVISNDILKLTSGQGAYSCLLTHKGKILSYFRVYQVGTGGASAGPPPAGLGEALILEDVGEIGEATFSALRKFLLYGTKAKMENCAETWGLLVVSGPNAFDLIKAALGADLSSLKPLTFVTCDIGGHPALLIRTEETGEADIEILMPAEGLAEAWDRLWSAGQSMGLKPFGTAALESLRIEAGLPKAGPDLNEDVVPPEANLEGKAFSLTKGCYPGQEVVARMDTYGSVRRRLVGLVLAEPVVPPHGATLFSGEREVGWVSSAVQSPSLGKTIALGFPLRDFAQPSTALTVEIAGEREAATVHALPFVKGS